MILINIYNNIDSDTAKSQNRLALTTLKEQYPWWNTPRLLSVRIEGKADDAGDRLVAMFHPRATIAKKVVDITKLTHLSDEDIIDRFLQRNDYRIVAEEGDAENIAECKNGEDEDMVSEELAEIYEKQGLYDEAIATYRKLSLLNSEKSIYFAELIAKIESIRDGKR